MESLVFYIAGALTVLFTILMIFQRNPVASAVFLVASFFSLAAIYVLLQAHFVAALQILVYAGAIMVLFIFVIMLLNLQDDELVKDTLTVKNVILTFVGMALFVFIGAYLLQLPKISFVEVSPEFGTAREVAEVMFTTYVVPFEILGILLLVGLVGAILLGRRES